MDFMSLLSMFGGQGPQTGGALAMQQPAPGALPMQQGAQAAPGVQPVQQPGFGLNQTLMQGPPGQTQYAPMQPNTGGMSFMDRIQGMMGGNNDPAGQQSLKDMTDRLGMAQKLMQMSQMQQGQQQNGMQNQLPLQNMQHIQNQMRGGFGQSQPQQGYLAQGGGIAPQRRIVGNGY